MSAAIYKITAKGPLIDLHPAGFLDLQHTSTLELLERTPLQGTLNVLPAPFPATRRHLPVGNPSFGRIEYIERYWVADKSDPLIKEKELFPPLYLEKVNEVHGIVEPILENKSWKGNEYLSLNLPEKKSEERKENLRILFLLEEAISWKRHLAKYRLPFRTKRFRFPLGSLNKV